MNSSIPIISLRDNIVILDVDLARIYGVPTKRLNEQVKRNADRFPIEFAFRLAEQEWSGLKSQFATSSSRSEVAEENWSQLSTSSHGGRRKLPWAFTEHGALMAANVLNSPEAVKMSVFIVRAFIKQREALSANATILRRLAEIDKSLLLHDKALRDLYQKLLPLLAPPISTPRRPIGF